jgi:AraC-like DNA-binding protein
LISAVVADMLRCPPDATIGTLAAARGVSTRSLQRAFQRRVGVSPKWVLKRYRLHEAAERIATGEAENLTVLALDLGYFDVAHFTRQFTAAMGEPPGAYARRCAEAATVATAA